MDAIIRKLSSDLHMDMIGGRYVHVDRNEVHIYDLYELDDETWIDLKLTYPGLRCCIQSERLSLSGFVVKLVLTNRESQTYAVLAAFLAISAAIAAHCLWYY